MFTERLLAIEDDSEIAAIIERTAIEAGFKSFALCNSSDIEQVYHNFRPDVIVLDILMPEMDGFDILRFLKYQHSTTQIILLSGSEFTEMAQSIGLSYGLNIQTALSKPFRVHELKLHLEAVRMMLGTQPRTATGSIV